MAFRLKDGSLFIHVPRTGGTYVTKVLRELDLVVEAVGRKHDCPGVVPFDMRAPHYVFLREPYSLIKSTYSWLQGNVWGPWPKEKGDGRWWHPWSEITKGCESERLSFDRWLRWIVDERTGYVTRLYSKFADWPVSVIGRTERLDLSLLHMLDKMGIKRAASVRAMERAKGAKNGSPLKVEEASEFTQRRFRDSEAGALRLWAKGCG
jgi:hypothetical protein